MNTSNSNMTVIPQRGQTLIKITQSLAVRQKQVFDGGPVPHLNQQDVLMMMQSIEGTRNGKRDALLISVLFDSCLRVSEAISIRPCDLGIQSVTTINLKHSGTRSPVALSDSRIQALKAYCFDAGIKTDQRIFPFTRTRVFQIVSKAMQLAGVVKPEHVGSVHVLRHSGALERLKRSGNAREVQEQLRHSQTSMTLRYLRTLSHEEAVTNQGNIELWR